MGKLFTIISFLLIWVGCSPYESSFSADNWVVIGRGEPEWKRSGVVLKECLITPKKTLKHQACQISFRARATNRGSQVQIWSGFSFQDRDNRYALGLRGGNSNDIYLCKYSSKGDDLVALEPLDFKPVPGEWYQFKVVVWDGNIRVYLNEELKPRIAVRDEQPLNQGNVALGGGWIETEYKNLVIKNLGDQGINFFLADSIQYSTALSSTDKESLRIKQRSIYQPVEVGEPNEQRFEVPLNGDWLFMPEHLIKAHDAIKIEANDDNWHIMKVPAFWNPVRNWLHLQESDYPHPGSGVSDNYWQKEYDRCENFTFDFEKVKGAYYRQWITLPPDMEHKRTFLSFEAIAKVAQVWINGKNAGSHVGMFSEFKLDISDYITEGKNLIVVKVNNEIAEKKVDGDSIAEVAVTVEVTNDMLNSLPRGMFNKEVGGIWQTAKLIISNKVLIDDVFVKTQTDGAEMAITLTNYASEDEELLIEGEFLENGSNNSLYKFSKNSIILTKGGDKKITISTGKIEPKLWSPEFPNLYTLVIKLLQGPRVIDEFRQEIGFRTFETKGNKFYLNGNPYWLRGANHPPIGMAPNNAELANKFFKLMHDNNQMVTRTHGAPITREWATAANRQGVGISVEGNWPWVMLGKGMPSMYLLDLWKNEMLNMVKKYRNDPSILAWTISNESYFTNYYVNTDTPKGRNERLMKWKVMSDVIKEIRQLDPTRPISPTSGYIRHTPDYEEVLKPAGIDDGDFDDSHNSYFGWYNKDHYFLYDGIWTKKLFLSTGATPNRPFISQELSSGYPNNDTGHPTRKYIFDHYVPQAWVGDWAYEDHDPKYYLGRNAFLTKEIGETIRRTSPDGAGVMHFANVCWYRNVFEADRMEPYPVVASMKKALSPVLISAELFGRNFYSGISFRSRICIVNDLENGKPLKEGLLEWQIVYQDRTLAEGSLKTNEVPHYGRLWNNVTIDLPKSLPASKVNCQLKFTLTIDNQVISENDYDLKISTPNWVAQAEKSNKKIHLFDPVGTTIDVFDKLGFRVSVIENLGSLDSDLLIVANIDSLADAPAQLDHVIRFAHGGGNVLFIHPGKHLQKVLPEYIESIMEESGRMVNMHIPESAVFNQIDPMELSWWQPHKENFPTVCRRSYRLKPRSKALELCTFLKVHSYLGNKEVQLKELGGSPLIELKIGKGTIVASELELNAADKDPIAGKVLMNLIEMLSNEM